jgi:hypothetical protein
MIETGPLDTDDVQEEDLILIRDILKSLTKTLKIFKAYLPNNPIYQKFATELHGKFNLFFDIHDSLLLKVEQFSLFFRGKEVFYNEDRTDNIALLLFVDGIREICLQKGITLNELISFIDVFRAVTEEKNLEDDVVTLFWERNFEHISYSVSEGFIENELLLEDEPLLEETLGERIPFGATYIDVLVSSGIDFKVDPIRPDELDSLSHETERVEGDGLLSEVIELFFEIIATEKDTEGFRRFAESIGKIIDMMLDKNDVRKASEISGRLKALLESGIIPEHREIVNGVINRAGSEERIKELFKDNKNIEDIQAYITLLNKNAITPLLSLLGELEDRKMRRVVCNVLSVIGRQDIETLAKGIHDERWYLVRNILMILGMTKDPKAIKYVKERLRHPEPKVRKEAIKALESIGSEEIKGHLMGVLKDKDSSVRTDALKVLRRFGGEGLFATVKEIVLKDDFRERPFAEKRELLETFGETGKEKALPILSRFFKKKGLFKSIEKEELRASAAYGLGLINTKEASVLLEKGSRKKGFVGNASKEALIRAGIK